MANMNGSKYSDIFPNPYPIKTPIISRIPIDMAISNVRRFDTPASINGAIITIPSGMFCNAILNDTSREEWECCCKIE